MNPIKYVIYNGKPLKLDEPVLFHNNRAFRFGDALFESMHANGTEIQFFEQHYERIINALKVLRMNTPENFSLSLIYAEIKSLLVRNKLFQGAKVRITIFRDGGGTYTPETNNSSYFIETEKLASDKYELNRKGHIIEIFPEIKKPVNVLSFFKTANAQLFVLAAIYKTEKKFDEVIILNENGNLIEATSSNLFVVKKNLIYTPSIEEGCVNGIMRNQVIEIAIKNKLTVFEDCRITVDDLLTADEVFLTNAVKGIQWVLAFRDRRYFNKVSKALVAELNKLAFN